MPSGKRNIPIQGAAEPIAALNRVRILERRLAWSEREPLVDVRTFCPHVAFVENLCPYLRRRVAQMLNAAQDALPEGYRLRAHTALRTRAMQKRGWDNYFQKQKDEHPQWPLSALRRATNRYYAPYDQKAPPGHCTGGAVDVKLLDNAGNELDLIAPTSGWEAAYTWSDKLSPEAKTHRMRMVEAMLSAGFSNCREEYWHYSWGDSAWAVRVGEPECPYGWIHPPVVLQSDHETLEASRLEMAFERDAEGRALNAEGELELPKGEWRFGLLWAQDVPTVLRLHLPQNAATPSLFGGDNRENWTPITCLERASDTLTLNLTPQVDRLFIANFAPPPETNTPT